MTSPALLTRMSIPPKSATILSTSAYLLKSPPEKRPDDIGRARLEAFIAGDEER